MRQTIETSAREQRAIKPATSARSPDDDRDTTMLLAWLSEHDEPCPLCGYNLRALTRPTCPECRQELVLTVGTRDVRLAWLLAALAPGVFSGIAAALLLIPIVVATITEGGRPPLAIVALDAFGWLSGLSAIALATRRTWFLRLSVNRQRLVALTAWAIHIGAFLVLLLAALFF